MTAPVRIEMFCRAVPSSLAATTPVVRRLAADCARMRDYGARLEMRHSLGRVIAIGIGGWDLGAWELGSGELWLRQELFYRRRW